MINFDSALVRILNIVPMICLILKQIIYELYYSTIPLVSFWNFLFDNILIDLSKLL
jgi:hypothetical protein